MFFEAIFFFISFDAVKFSWLFLLLLNFFTCVFFCVLFARKRENLQFEAQYFFSVVESLENEIFVILLCRKSNFFVF